jgi:hypothetical protein
MALDLLFFITLACSIAGITFFLYSLVIIRKIKSLFPSGTIGKKWNMIQTLIIIFLFGYVFNIIFNAIDFIEVVVVMTAIVYIFGGFFVMIIINLSYRTYRIIVLEKTESNQND